MAAEATGHEHDRELFAAALAEARTGLAEGGVPVGAALGIGGRVLATGRNRRVQWGSVIRHGETDCLEHAGRLPAREYARATLATTLSPCHMCTGAILLYGIGRVLVGEHDSFRGPEHLLRSAGVEIVMLDSAECRELMRAFVSEHPDLWHEDIGEPN